MTGAQTLEEGGEVRVGALPPLLGALNRRHLRILGKVRDLNAETLHRIHVVLVDAHEIGAGGAEESSQRPVQGVVIDLDEEGLGAAEKRVPDRHLPLEVGRLIRITNGRGLGRPATAPGRRRPCCGSDVSLLGSSFVSRALSDDVWRVQDGPDAPDCTLPRRAVKQHIHRALAG